MSKQLYSPLIRTHTHTHTYTYNRNVRPNTFEGHSYCVLVSFLTDVETETMLSLLKEETVLVWQVPTLHVERAFQVSFDSRSRCEIQRLQKILAVSRDGVTDLEYNLRRTHQDPFLETPMVSNIGSQVVLQRVRRMQSAYMKFPRG